MNHFSVEKLFSIFDDTAQILEKELSCIYLEALVETAENMFQSKILQDEVSELTAKRLRKKYEQVNLETVAREDIRKAFQLAMLKGMKQQTQHNHQMTPDGVGMLVSYLVQKFMGEFPQSRILDPAVGTGNLLTTVLNGQEDKQITAIGVDVDDLLLRLAYVNANLQKHPIQFFNQDSLEPLFVDPVDIVVSDLPVGYYPNNERANEYELKAEQGYSYAHHLFIEQSCRHVKPGGYLIFIIPNNLFETDEAEKLHKYIKENMVIQGLLQLPSSIFQNKQAVKSIIILQKRKKGLIFPKQVLLVQLPKLSNAPAMEQVLQQMNEWFIENKQ